MSSFFGTDGIRAPLGTEFFTQESLPRVAHALSVWIKATYSHEAQRAKVLIIHDTRNSCAYIKSILKMVFFSQSIDVVDGGALPTPAAWYLIQKYGYDCAVIISASHNPWYDNGIKIIDSRGKLSAHAEALISHALRTPPVAHTIDYHHLGTEYIIDGVAEYHALLAPLFKNNFLQGLTLVIDCAHGATSIIAPEIFRFFGARVIAINNQPTGFNINEESGSLNPKILSDAVIAHKADMGFAFDGDGDRVIGVNKKGVVKNGDALIALLSEHPDYRDQKIVVGTIMTNIGLQRWLEGRNKQCIRTAVGDKYVAQALDDQTALLGGEQSGHIILKNYTTTGDGILAALKVLETLLITNNPYAETFTPFPQVLVTVPVGRVCDLSHNPYQEVIKAAQAEVASGRISVRYSGTEKNMLRIMVESEQLTTATTVAHMLARSLQKELS